jgi:hypothetical protein
MKRKQAKQTAKEDSVHRASQNTSIGWCLEKRKPRRLPRIQSFFLRRMKGTACRRRLLDAFQR